MPPKRTLTATKPANKGKKEQTESKAFFISISIFFDAESMNKYEETRERAGTIGKIYRGFFTAGIDIPANIIRIQITR